MTAASTQITQKIKKEALTGRFALNYKYIQSCKLCTAKMWQKKITTKYICSYF